MRIETLLSQIGIMLNQILILIVVMKCILISRNNYNNSDNIINVCSNSIDNENININIKR